MINLSMNQRITILFFTLLRTISQVLEHIESHHKHTQSLIFYSAPWNFKVCFSEAMTKSKLVSLNEKLMCQSVGWNCFNFKRATLRPTLAFSIRNFGIIKSYDS